MPAGCGNGAGTLPGSPESLPYALVPAAPTAVYYGSFVAVDLDNDGIEEEIKYDEGIGGASFLSVSRIRDNQFYNLHTKHLMSGGGVCGLTDITGDGTPELIWWWLNTPERALVFATEVEADDVSASLSTLHSIEFNTEEDQLPNGDWGASVAMRGAFDLNGDGVTDALALIANAGITLRPRDILLWDLATDSVKWRLPTGATPTGGAEVVDVTGNGTQDLVIGLEAPGNGAAAG
ncbi:MAG TPA: hypothetical protein VE960_06130, partial [bacterium]|nr:hypothetical protein [bacterium]